MKKFNKKLTAFFVIALLIGVYVVNNKVVVNNSKTYSLQDYQKRLIEKFAPAAIEEMKETGVFASITIAQAAQEGGWGNDKLAAEFNNYFGMKANVNGSLRCDEYDSGTKVQSSNTTKFWSGWAVCMSTPKDGAGSKHWFRVYDTPNNSIKDHSWNLWCIRDGRYIKNGAFEAQNASQQLKAIDKAGYAVIGEYYDQIWAHISNSELNLEQYDVGYQSVKPEWASCTDFKYEGEVPEIETDDNPEEYVTEAPGAPMQYAPLGQTSYSGDIEQGYIHGNQGGYSLHFGKNATKSEKEETILDIVQDIYEEAIVRPSDLKNGAEAYKTHVTYLNNGIFNGQIAYYSQGAYNTPGSYGGYGSIATHGCGPTSMSIVLSSFGQNVSPVESTNWACSNGYCTGSGSKHSLICDESNHYGLNCSEKSPFEPSDQQELVDKLSSGNYLAVVLAKTGHFTSGGHFFVLTGVNDKNEITVADPGDSSKNNNSYSLDFLINPTQGHVQKVWLISK